jgi:hypothetical protein
MKRARVALRAAGLTAAIGLGLAWAGESYAEIRRVEAVGVVPLIQSGPGSVDVLDQAVQAALREAVSRVARDFLMEAEPGEGEGEDLAAVLGKRMVPYTARFRILDDQGERPALFAEDPRVTSEYVVEVEVFVDAERVQQRLVEAGLLEPDPGRDAVSRIELEMRGLSGYGAYEAMRVLLTEQLGARQALAQSFEQGIAVLEVEIEGWNVDADSLAEQLLDRSTPELAIRPLELDQGRLVVWVDWSPAAGDGDAEPAARDR